MANPLVDYRLSTLTNWDLNALFFDLLTESNPNSWKSGYKADYGRAAQTIKAVAPEKRVVEITRLLQELDATRQQQAKSMSAQTLGLGFQNLPSIEDVFKRTVSEDSFERWKREYAKFQAAVEAGAGAAKAAKDYGIAPENLAFAPLPEPVSPEGGLTPAVDGGIPRTPRTPITSENPIEIYQDLRRQQAGISDQLDALYDDPQKNGLKIQRFEAEAALVAKEIQNMLPFVLQKGDVAERMALNREELEFRREQERNVGARHAAGLGESAASRAQAAAQFAERQAFEREKERTDLVKFQEQLEQQLRQLTMQAAQLNVPLGFQFQGPNGPVTPPTTQISLPAQAPNLQAVLAAAGA